MSLSRTMAIAAGVAVTMVGSLGLASPASATYANDPVSRAWSPDGPVHSSVGTASRLFIGGSFSGGGGIAALNPTTGALLWSVQADGDVRAMALSDDGSRLLVGGGFTHVGGTTHRHLAAMNVSDGSVVANWRAGASGMVRDLVVRGDQLFVGGQFGRIRGVAQRGLGALSVSTGQLIPAFTGSVDRHVYGLALTNNQLLVSGRFNAVNGQSRSSIASFNLSNYQLTSWAPRRLCAGCNAYWDVVTDGTNAYVGTSGPGGNLGAFNLVSGNNPWRYVHANGDVQALALPGDGLLYLGGHFGQYVGNSNIRRTDLAAVNPNNGQVDPDFHPKLFKRYPGVWTFATTPGMLHAGGNFLGMGAGPNARNNHVPYLTAFGIQ